MKFSNYFLHTRLRLDRKEIDMKWIEETFSFPEKESVQEDGRVRRWKYIEDAAKYLRIAVLEDKETIHNAFFDRSFKLK